MHKIAMDALLFKKSHQSLAEAQQQPEYGVAVLGWFDFCT